MLQKLSIRNYAIIDQLEIDFPGKLNVITGETGAGKSILMGALDLVLGARADSSILPDKEKKCVVEAFFEVRDKKPVNDFLKENEFDADEELSIRREISVAGKSRAFVNDTPINLDQLRILGSLLVDLHQQFDTLELGKADFQREVLDALAGNLSIVADYGLHFGQWQQMLKELVALRSRKEQFDKEADYNQFQFNELEEAGFAQNELEQADADLKLLGNAEAIKSALNKASFELQDKDEPVLQQLKSLANQLNSFASYHPDLTSLVERLQAAQTELKDLAGEIGRIGNKVNFDPKKIEQLNERISTGYRLLKKHGVKTTGELLEIKKQLAEKLQAIFNIDDEIRQKEKACEEIREKALEIATSVSKARNKQVKPLEEKVNKLLIQVGMPNARLKVEVRKTELNAFGMDAVEFMFDANIPAPAKGQGENSGSFQSLRKVASGGELSRLMLCIKSLVAQSMDLPTMIFDEIDSGISGEAARQVGIIMKSLAAKRQLICITHQPQIAGKADTHFFVYKEIVKDKVVTAVRKLSTEERIITIAKMLSGERPTAAAMENAREMVRN